MMVDITLQKALKTVSGRVLGPMVSALNFLLGSVQSKIPENPNLHAYLKACIFHAVSGDHSSIEKLWTAQTPEIQGTIILISPSTGEKMSVSLSSEGIQWFRQFVLSLRWISIFPEVSQRVGQCPNCEGFFLRIRKNQTLCGKTCPRKGTQKRIRPPGYLTSYKEYSRRVRNGASKEDTLSSMREDPRYKDIIEKYGQRWVESAKEK